MNNWKKMMTWIREHPWMAFAIVALSLALSVALIAYIVFEGAMRLLQFTTNGRFDWTARRARFLRDVRQERSEIQWKTNEVKEVAAQLNAAMDKYEEASKTIH